MKYIITLDSSNTFLTVGIATSDKKLLEVISYEAWQTQSEHMIPELNKLSVKYNASYKDIASVIVSIGPGSYTGIRIALTIAKTIAVACNCKVYPVSSLQVQKCAQKPSICLINARSNRSYFGVYEGHKCLEKDCVKNNEEVLTYINNHPDYIICGNASYLGKEGYISNISLEMLSLLDYLEPSNNPIGIKPAYLKD